MLSLHLESAFYSYSWQYLAFSQLLQTQPNSSSFSQWQLWLPWLVLHTGMDPNNIWIRFSKSNSSWGLWHFSQVCSWLFGFHWLILHMSWALFFVLLSSTLSCFISAIHSHFQVVSKELRNKSLKLPSVNR